MIIESFLLIFNGKQLINMKTLVCNILFFIGVINVLNGQSYGPCNTYPTKEEIMVHLASRPGGGLNHRELNSCNSDSSVRNRLLYLLDWRWSQREIDDYTKRSFLKMHYDENAKELAKKKAKGNDSIYTAVYDSFESAIRKKLMPKMFVLDEVVYSIGQLDMKEAIPMLKKALQDSQHYYIESVVLALARLGDKQMESKILESLKYDSTLNGNRWLTRYNQVYDQLVYIASQESMFCFHEWLDTSKVYDQVSDYESYPPTTKNAFNVVSAFRYANLIMNEDFVAYLKANTKFPLHATTNNEIILYCKNWLIENKGKYIIRRYN
jgi:hypothetical protein